MKTRTTLAVAIVAAAHFGALPTLASAADSKNIVGAWKLVTNVGTDAAGKKSDIMGPGPLGQAVFTSNGRYSIYIARADLPKFASNNRLKATPDENKAVVSGMIAHMGSYTVDEKDKSFTVHIESSTFPNWNGTTQKRTYTLAGDELKWGTAAASGGGRADLVWKRLK
jgi:hypothetical protein